VLCRRFQTRILLPLLRESPTTRALTADFGSDADVSDDSDGPYDESPIHLVYREKAVRLTERRAAECRLFSGAAREEGRDDVGPVAVRCLHR
jgi:hypothetical protein